MRRVENFFRLHLFVIGVVVACMILLCGRVQTSIIEKGNSESVYCGEVDFQPSIGDYFACGTNINESEFFDWWNAAENGNEWAQCRMGDYYSTNGLSLYNHCEGLNWWLASAEQGNVVAKYRLIKYYFLTSFEEWCRPHPFLHGLLF
jgi:hypothetical protein